MPMLLELIGISKYFPGVKALQNIDFTLRHGEVHALCGENGAGKSTLMNVLTGNLMPDEGKIKLKGHEVRILHAGHAASLGIAIVYQQLSLVNTLSVADNIFANIEPNNWLGLVNRSALLVKTAEHLANLNIEGIHPATLVGHLSPGQKQMVEIAKALFKDPDVLILDEPTASITDKETETLFGIIRKMKLAGKSVIYISHRMKEVFSISDKITILKDGQQRGTFFTKEISEQQLIQKMVGRELHEGRPNFSFANGEDLLQVSHLTGRGFKDISFTLKKGEILGFAGLVGAGRSEIAQAIFGFSPAQSGTIRLDNRAELMQHPDDAIRAGIGYLPEDRRTQGLFLNRSVADNIVVSSLQSAVQHGMFRDSRADGIAEQYQNSLRIVTPSIHQKVSHLSGGNQQKTLIARWLLADPEVLIADEPTHGVDVGAKHEIYEIFRKFTTLGKGLMLISSDLTELLTLANRIIVIRRGRIAGELAAAEATEEKIISLAI